MMNMHSGRKAVAMMRMMGCNNGRYIRNFLRSDCAIDEKTVVLHKKENEGFGFVLRGAKGKPEFLPSSPTLTIIIIIHLTNPLSGTHIIS